MSFSVCENVNIEDCDLFGSGTIGVELVRSSNFTMENSIIRECTYGLLDIQYSDNVLFSDMIFEDTGEFELIQINNSNNVNFEYSDFNDNWGYNLIQISKTNGRIIFRECDFVDNENTKFCNDLSSISLIDCYFEDNSFKEP